MIFGEKKLSQKNCDSNSISKMKILEVYLQLIIQF